MITPNGKDLGRKVRYRGYEEGERFQTGRWLEGRLRGISRLFVVVEFDEDIREINRADLEYVK